MGLSLMILLREFNAKGPLELPLLTAEQEANSSSLRLLATEHVPYKEGF